MILTSTDLAKRWGVSLPTIYKLFHSGSIPGMRITQKNIRFRLADIEAYEAGRWNTSTSTPAEPEDDPQVARLVLQMEKVLSEDLSEQKLTFGGVPIVVRR